MLFLNYQEGPSRKFLNLGKKMFSLTLQTLNFFFFFIKDLDGDLLKGEVWYGSL